MRNIWKIVLFLLLMGVSVGAGVAKADGEQDANADYARAKVLSVTEDAEGVRKIVAEMKGGKFDGQEVDLIDQVSERYPMKVSEGTTVLVMIEETDGEENFYLQDIYRVPYLIWLLVVFVVALLLVGRYKGLRALISLMVAIAMIFWVYIPQVLLGRSPTWLGLGIAVLLLVISLVLITGFSRKTLVAFLGALGGLLFSILIAFIFSKLSRLTGFSSDEAYMLSTFRGALSLEGVLYGGIIIGTLGAVMDVAVSVASGMSEVVAKSSEKLGVKKLFSAGMNVGRDIMGTMANTLIFAYVGASLPMVLLFSVMSDSMAKIMNMEFIAEELIRSLAGTTALFMIVPLTAYLGARLLRKENENIGAKRSDG